MPTKKSVKKPTKRRVKPKPISAKQQILDVVAAWIDGAVGVPEQHQLRISTVLDYSGGVHMTVWAEKSVGYALVYKDLTPKA